MIARLIPNHNGNTKTDFSEPGDDFSYFENEYEQLRNHARCMLRAERVGHTLQPTALVNEVFLRIGHGRNKPWANSTHFYIAATDVMRKVLLDYAKHKNRLKRGREFERVPFNEYSLPGKIDKCVDILALNEAFCRLEEDSKDAADVVRLRVFLGFTIPETAEALGLPEHKVSARWSYAKARLRKELKPN